MIQWFIDRLIDWLCCLSSGAYIDVPCEPGFYQPASGQASCLTCIQGAYWLILLCLSSGAYIDVPCEPGFYQPASGQASCLTCIQGAYWLILLCLSSGAYIDVPCEPGFYQPASGQASCLTCIQGAYCNESGTINGNSCPVGHYCPLGSVKPAECDIVSFEMTIFISHPQNLSLGKR